MRLRAWVVVLIGFLAGVALALVQNKVAPNVMFIMNDLQIGMTAVGWLSSIFNVMGMVMAIPAAVILNKLGAKISGSLALVVAIVGSLIGIFSESVGILLFSRIVEGFGVGLIAVIGPALIYMWFPVARRGFPIGIWGSWQMVAQATVFFVSGYITLNYGWKGVWWFCLIACAIVAVLYMWKISNPPDEHNYADIESTNISYKAGFSSLSTWLMGIAFLIYSLCAFAFATWMAPYWSETFGWDVDTANKWVGNLYIIEIFAVIVVGYALDKVAKQRKIIGLIAFLLSGFVLYYCFTMKTDTFMIPLIAGYAVFEGTVPIVIYILCPQTVKDSALAGLAMGIVCVGMNMGMVIGPPIMGAMVESYGWHAGGILLLVLSTVGTVLMAFTRIYEPQSEVK